MEDSNIIKAQTEWTFEKKVEGYNISENDFAVPRELTVTITLAEYRKLLLCEAERIKEKANSDWLKEYTRANSLQKEVEELKSTIARMAQNCSKEEEEKDE